MSIKSALLHAAVTIAVLVAFKKLAPAQAAAVGL